MNEHDSLLGFRQEHIISFCRPLITDMIRKSPNCIKEPWYSDLFLKPSSFETLNSNYRCPKQYVVVSDWFGEELKLCDQLVTNYWGFYIWGREEYTLSILDSQVFRAIYNRASALTPANSR